MKCMADTKARCQERRVCLTWRWLCRGLVWLVAAAAVGGLVGPAVAVEPEARAVPGSGSNSAAAATKTASSAGGAAEPAGPQPAGPDEPAADSPPGAQTKFEKAFSLTMSAKTLEDFEAIIALCEAGLKEELTAQQAAYGKRLLSWALNGRGELQAGTDEASALADFQRAIELDEKNWKALFNRGVARAVAGALEEAEGDFDQVLQLRPGFSKAWLNRAELRRQQGRFRDAIADYTQLLRLRPKDQSLAVDALLGRGHCHYMLRSFPQAVADYNAVLEIDPTNVLAYTYRGDVRFDQQAYGLAAADYRRAVDLPGVGARTYLSAAWFLATCPSSRYRDAELALKAAQHAMELSSAPDWHCLEVLAAAHANAGDFDQAVAYQSKVLEMAPPDAEGAARRLELYRNRRPYRRELQQPSQAAR